MNFPCRGDVWVHVESETEYLVVMYGRLESTCEVMVTYKEVDKELEDGACWHRPLYEFLQPIKATGMTRFVPIDEFREYKKSL